jgi:eukaryotic-like serine/threonine-protein kinase
VSWLPDATLDHLRVVAEQPDLSGTRYEIVELLARGGMGTVYLAWDRELGRQVALKVISAPEPDRRTSLRMRREAQILARLEHPGIVPVHDVGSLPDGRMYYVMKNVRGRRLDAFVRESGDLTALLRTFERICDAVAFAHAHGVIHRDLKPENVMVGAFGEVLVMDWGVAKVLGEAGAEAGAPEAAGTGRASAEQEAPADGGTAHGTVLGTPGYMSPEQARGEVVRLDERTDVFGLGAILYYMLTAEPPIHALDTLDRRPAGERTGDRARAGVEPPRRRRPGVPRPLEAICLKALDFEPERRYPGVRELAADVARFVSRRPVTAYPERLPERVLRVAAKHSTPILLIAAYLVMRVLLAWLARI